MQIRPAQPRDDDAIWGIIGPTIRAGETYVLPRDMSREAALSYWRAPAHEVFVAEEEDGRCWAPTTCGPTSKAAARMWPIAAT